MEAETMEEQEPVYFVQDKDGNFVKVADNESVSTSLPSQAQRKKQKTSAPAQCPVGLKASQNEVASAVLSGQTAPKIKAEDKTELQYHCKLCGKSFSKRYFLANHMRIHEGEKRYSCPVCQKSFSNEANMKRHKISHTDGKPFMCEQCGKKFTQLSTVKTHKQLHCSQIERTSSPVSCSICQKSFRSLRSLNAHFKKTHNEDMSYSCSECKETFSLKEELKEHKRLHTTVVSAAKDGQRRRKKLHSSEHVGKKSHECLICHEFFPELSALEAHVAVHGLSLLSAAGHYE